MKVGEKISAAHLAGGFVLPKKKETKLVFIAGGIGITPFRSMIHYLLDMKEKRPITVLYANKTQADVAYKDIFDRARAELGIKTVYSLSRRKDAGAGYGERPRSTRRSSRARSRIIAIAPSTFQGRMRWWMRFKKTLVEMGVSRLKIKSDFFPGFV